MQLPGGILSTESDPERVEAALNRSAPLVHFGVRARLDAERIRRASQADDVLAEIPFEELAAATVELPEIQLHHRGGTTISSVNGAVIALVCDLALGLTVISTGLPVSAGTGVGRLNIRMRKPLEGNSLSAVARIESARRNLIYARIEVLDEQGTLCSEAQGTVYRGRGPGMAVGV